MGLFGIHHPRIIFPSSFVEITFVRYTKIYSSFNESYESIEVYVTCPVFCVLVFDLNLLTPPRGYLWTSTGVNKNWFPFWFRGYFIKL